jgi:hypothetical protein
VLLRNERRLEFEGRSRAPSEQCKYRMGKFSWKMAESVWNPEKLGKKRDTVTHGPVTLARFPYAFIPSPALNCQCFSGPVVFS